MHIMLIFIFCFTFTTFSADTEVTLPYAKTVAEATLLINRGALKNLSEWDKNTLIYSLAWSDHEPELITLYKNHGLDVIACDENGWTLLMHLAFSPKKHMLQKAQLLLAGLNKEQLQQVIALKHSGDKTVSDIIDNERQQYRNWTNKTEYLYKFYLFLYEMNDSIETQS